ncbi:MAG: hypothetical protein HY587_05130 [Candidatus Omnitrophica bacterium]|nr:hypothetical protein [Candidatus Omnitrophota bacterium]
MRSFTFIFALLAVFVLAGCGVPFDKHKEIVAEMLTQIRELGAQVTALEQAKEAEVTAVQKDAEVLQAKLDESASENENLKTDYAALEEKIKELEEAKASLEKQLNQDEEKKKDRKKVKTIIEAKAGE